MSRGENEEVSERAQLVLQYIPVPRSHTTLHAPVPIRGTEMSED